MPRTVLIAPVGWYLNRLLTSIYRAGADQTYLIKGKANEEKTSEIYAKVTERVSQKVIEKLPLNVRQHIAIEEADFYDFRDVYKTFVKIINMERMRYPKSKVIIDVTSTTKIGDLAAAMVGKIYDVTISYVFPKAKRKFEEPKDVEALLKEWKSEVDDPGGRYFKYDITPLLIEEQWVDVLQVVYDHPHEPIGRLIGRIEERIKTRKSTSASRRYWGRVLDKLQSRGLVEFTRERKEVTVSTTDAGLALVEGIKDARKEIGSIHSTEI